MDPFVNAFFQIDTDGDERITLHDLRNYARRNGLDQSIVNRWQTLFDKNNSGTITLNEFCETLGLQPSEIRMHRTTAQLVTQPGVRKEIHVIMATMPLNMQIDIGNAIFGLVTEHGKNKEQLTDRIKKYLDRSWIATST
ncbi:hypothetical protein EG68_09825 [Paragonimus skrjabini miyazakii]|uniref:EF-hand domain-containing protein n=1 Tax=Paragonimus skrjabini miyazakii TaxID=59628 RepID=A0A8S9YHB6_9TREM|nr:hypothetical protein EG68_09825 [Paragonimus skrjabini miyazakii]